MKAFNKRKLSSEIRLFLTKGQKIHLVKGTPDYQGRQSFKLTTENGKKAIHGTAFGIRHFYKEWSRITKTYGVGCRIENFEEIHNLKIKDLKLERIDFSNKNYDKNLFKIVSALRVYKNN